MPHPHRIARAVAWNAARAHAWATGSRLFACYRELQANQRLSADELRAHSNRNLRKTIAHAHEHVPYYRRLFRERGLEPRAIRTVDDLPLLPVLTKQIIRSHFDELHPVPLPKGGSTLQHRRLDGRSHRIPEHTGDARLAQRGQTPRVGMGRVHTRHAPWDCCGGHPWTCSGSNPSPAGSGSL